MDTTSFSEEKRQKAKDLYLAFNTNQDFFTAQVYRLIYKADKRNLERLALAFPLEVSLFIEWGLFSEREFYDRYRIGDLLNEPEKSAYEKRRLPA